MIILLEHLMSTELPVSVTLLANAKINLFLDITGRLSDGYHSVSTVMQSVTLADRVSVSRSSSHSGIRISFTPETACLPTDRSNTAYRAAEAFFDATGESFGIDVRIDKQIPQKAGLGGGSADAAAVLTALNMLSGGPLDAAALIACGAKVGADVPFCVAGGCRFCGGKGETVGGRLRPASLFFLIMKPDAGISTPAAYAALDAKYPSFGGRGADPSGLIEALGAGDRPGTASRLYNIFEEVLEEGCPEAFGMLSFLKSFSMGSGLCGSGSAVYAAFLTKESAERAERLAAKRFPGAFTFVCRGTGHGVELPAAGRAL